NLSVYHSYSAASPKHPNSPLRTRMSPDGSGVHGGLQVVRFPPMARRDVFIDHLQQVSLFSACSRKDLQLVAKRAEDVRVAAGKAIVSEGETGHEFFAIISGTATVTRHGQKIATLGPGDAFGE